ncbi:MAG: Ig-like domain-containing protein, partial [Gemmata sp.]
SSGPAMLGTYESTGATLTFRPRFKLAAGECYRATISTSAGTFQREYRVPRAPLVKPAAVTAVFPTSAELPCNQLKFYVHFSRPMREGPAVFDRIKLLDDKGGEVEDPWRRTELWNEDATRLTLWIHPGRVKEGVNLRDEIGPVLEPDRNYTLVISEKVLDAEGRSLAGYQKTFRTTAAVRAALDVRDWKLTAPKADTTNPFEVRFPRPLDHALLGRSLTVLDADGKPVAGAGAAGKGERSWSFAPERPWKPGAYTLRAREALEDLAGNTLSRPFDLNLDAPARKGAPREREFRIER